MNIRIIRIVIYKRRFPIVAVCSCLIFCLRSGYILKVSDTGRTVFDKPAIFILFNKFLQCFTGPLYVICYFFYCIPCTIIIGDRDIVDPIPDKLFGLYITGSRTVLNINGVSP